MCCNNVHRIDLVWATAFGTVNIFMIYWFTLTMRLSRCFEEVAKCYYWSAARLRRFFLDDKNQRVEILENDWLGFLFCFLLTISSIWTHSLWEKKIRKGSDCLAGLMPSDCCTIQISFRLHLTDLHIFPHVFSNGTRMNALVSQSSLFNQPGWGSENSEE